MYDDKNQLVGFDVDVSKKLAAMLGVKVTYVTVDPNTRVPFVTSGRIDMVMGGMTRTPDRAKLIDFTVPIMTESLGALSVKGKPFKNLADLDKPNVDPGRGARHDADPLDRGQPAAGQGDPARQPSGRAAGGGAGADAVVDDLASLGQIAKNVDAKWMPLEGHAKEVDWDCIGLARADPTLKHWLNVAIFSLEQDEFVQQA